jgi:hypothetical protein
MCWDGASSRVAIIVDTNLCEGMFHHITHSSFLQPRQVVTLIKIWSAFFIQRLPKFLQFRRGVAVLSATD